MSVQGGQKEEKQNGFVPSGTVAECLGLENVKESAVRLTSLVFGGQSLHAILTREKFKRPPFVVFV
jgi:hypothetical protein